MSLWSGQTATQSGGYSFDFTTPAVSNVVTARLLVGIYGGSASNTCNLMATVNGGTAASLTLGGTGDVNPEFTANQTNVYGSASSGDWLVSIPVTANLTASGGTDAVKITATTTSGLTATSSTLRLWEVYQNPSLNNQFQYAVGEGNGDIYNSLPNNAPGGVTTALRGCSIWEASTQAMPRRSASPRSTTTFIRPRITSYSLAMPRATTTLSWAAIRPSVPPAPTLPPRPASP